MLNHLSTVRTEQIEIYIYSETAGQKYRNCAIKEDPRSQDETEKGSCDGHSGCLLQCQAKFVAVFLSEI